MALQGASNGGVGTALLDLAHLNENFENMTLGGRALPQLDIPPLIFSANEGLWSHKWLEASGSRWLNVSLRPRSNRATPDGLSARFQFIHVQLQGAIFERAKLDSVVFDDCDLTGSHFNSGAVQSENSKAVDSKEENRTVLRGVTFSRSNLMAADFAYAKLFNVVFTMGHFDKTGNMVDGDGHPNMKGANFSYATISGGSFGGANLTGALFSHAELSNIVDLRDSIIEGADFSGVDLSSVLLTDSQVQSICKNSLEPRGIHCGPPKKT